MQIIPDSNANSSDLASLQIEDFWDRHGKTVIIAAVVAIVAAIVIAIVFVLHHNRQIEAQATFSTAVTEADYVTVINTYPGSAPATDAALLLAGLQRKSGKYEEAIATLQAFLKTSPDSPYAGLASLGIAMNQEAMGQAAPAQETLQQTAAKYSSSFVAPFALLMQAQAFIAQGKNQDAASVLRNLTTQYSDSVSASIGNQYLEKLDSLVDSDPKN